MNRLKIMDRVLAKVFAFEFIPYNTHNFHEDEHLFKLFQEKIKVVND